MSVWIGDIRYRLLMLTPVSRWPSSQLLHSAAHWRIHWSAVDHCHCYCCLWQGEETGKRPEAPARCYTVLHCATLCYIALHTHSTILHCTPCVQHCVCIAQHSNAQHCTTLYYIVLHYTALHTADYGRLVVSKTVFFEIMQISGKSLTFALWYSIVYISCLLHVKIPQEYKTSLASQY